MDDQTVVPDGIFVGHDILAEVKTKVLDEGPSADDIAQAKRYRTIIVDGIEAVDGVLGERKFKKVNLRTSERVVEADMAGGPQDEGIY